MHVTIVQMHVQDKIEENLRRILSHISESDTDTLCFPETCLVSNEKDACDISEYLDRIGEAARLHDTNVIFGSYCIDNQERRNGIFVMGRTGKELYRYWKRHVYMEEKGVVPGTGNRTLEIDGIRCAIINCWDYAFPEDIRALAREGAKIIFCPSYLLSHPDTGDVLERMPQVRAFDSMAYFVMVDAFSEDSFKQSRICHPLRELASIKERPGTISAELDMQDIGRLRKKYRNLG